MGRAEIPSPFASDCDQLGPAVERISAALDEPVAFQTVHGVRDATRCEA